MDSYRKQDRNQQHKKQKIGVKKAYNLKLRRSKKQKILGGNEKKNTGPKYGKMKSP